MTILTTQSINHFNNHHDHTVCMAHALDKARTICAHNQVRFTALRQRVFELVWASHQPALAYNLLSQLRLERQNAAPPTVYRTLDFLLDNHLIHRIETLNAYVGCTHPERSHISQFLICNQCQQAAELINLDVNQAIANQAVETGFSIAHQTIEITGLCPACQQ